MAAIAGRDGELNSELRQYRYRGAYPSEDPADESAVGEVLVAGRTIPALWVSHYRAHAAASLAASGWDDATILCLDGGGDFGYGAAFAAEAGRLRPLRRYLDWRFGLGYHEFAERFFGTPGFHEGKLMAAAVYGRRGSCPVPVFDDTGRVVFPDGPISVHAVARCQSEFVAAVEALLDDPALAHENLVCGGGCFLNIDLNRRLAESGQYRRIYVPPFAGDMGTAIGATMVAAWRNGLSVSPDRLATPFLGDDVEIDLPQLVELVTAHGDVPRLDSGLGPGGDAK